MFTALCVRCAVFCLFVWLLPAARWASSSFFLPTYVVNIPLLLFVFNSSHLCTLCLLIPSQYHFVCFQHNETHTTYVIRKERSNNKSRALFSKYETRGIAFFEYCNKVRWVSQHITSPSTSHKHMNARNLSAKQMKTFPPSDYTL